MSNILVATLGESPVVVSATVKALKEIQGIRFERVYVIYPKKAHLFEFAYELIEKTLETFDSDLEVLSIPLPGEDMDSTDSVRQFLRIFTRLLEELGAFSQGKYNIYVSIAGGRKSMSTVALLPCQVAETVRGLFHLIEKDDGSQESIIPIDRLLTLSYEEQTAKMLPSINDLSLVDIPFPKFPHKREFLKFIRSRKDSTSIQLFEKDYLSYAIDPDWRTFFEPIFSGESPSEELFEQSQLRKNPIQGTLIMPLGESPAIVFQTYKLLELSGKQVQKIIVIYPEENQQIRQAIGWLRGGFRKLPPDFQALPLEDLEGVYKKEECFIFQEKIIDVISTQKQESPDTSIWLSFSGGQKTMAVFTVLAAQATHIPHVYHTLITDPVLEKDLTEMGKISKLEQMSLKQRQQFLFPDKLDEEKFSLFKIPLILFKNSEDKISDS